ncbi:MAG: hypothetical protein JNJ41_00945 [Bacteroidia bacterium]|nr:hypothetical protein [Bacteroidia bacterium]
MKTLAIYLFFSFSVCLQAKEWIPDYRVTKSGEDKTLKKTETFLVLTFFDSNFKPVKKEMLFSYNSVNKKQKPDQKGQIALKTLPGKYVFKFFCDKDHSEITTDSISLKPGFRTEMTVEFKSSLMPVIAEKPVIYVYNTAKEKVSVKLDLKGNFLFTYPEYNTGWHFTSNPDGTIEMNNKKYHYLFWDGNINIETRKLNLNEGFVVDKKDLTNFFEEKLAQMGLNSQEIEDYITYWCPRMSANEKNFVHFIFNKEYNNYASITIDPQPDQLFRVYMLWSKAGDAPVKEQQLEKFKRSGFTVVEWGGTEIKEQLNFNN